MRYRARTSIFYLSINSGEEVFVKEGDEFDDMAPSSVKHELEAGNIEEVKDGKPSSDTRESG